MAPNRDQVSIVSNRQSVPMTGPMTNARLSFLFVLDIAADNVGDIGILFFLFLDEGAVVIVIEAFVDLNIIVAGLGLGGCGLFGSGRLGVSLLERNGLDFLRFGRRRHLLGRRRPGGGRSFRPSARYDRRDLIDRTALRAVDRVLVQVIELGAATGAKPLSTQFGFGHGRILRVIRVLHLASRNAAVNS